MPEVRTTELIPIKLTAKVEHRKQSFLDSVSELRETIDIVANNPKLDPVARADLNMLRTGLDYGEKSLLRYVSGHPENALGMIRLKEDALDGSERAIRKILASELGRACTALVDKAYGFGEYAKTLGKKRKEGMVNAFEEAAEIEEYVRVNTTPRIISSSERQLANALHEAFEFDSRLDDLVDVLEYTGPSITQETLTLAEHIEEWLRRSAGQQLDHEIRSFVDLWNSGHEGKTSEQAVKDIAYETAYALELLGGGSLKKIPPTHRPRAEAFEHAIKAKQLDRKICEQGTKVFLSSTAEQDIVKLYYAIGIGGQDTGPMGEFVLMAKKVIDVRAEALNASRVRACASLRQFIGTAEEYELPLLKAKTPYAHLDEARHDYVDYLLLKTSSILHFELARKEALGLISCYGAHLARGHKRMLLELAIADPFTNEPVLLKGSEEEYLESLGRTITRWNDLGKEFRKLPYNFEEAVRDRFRATPLDEQRDIALSAGKDFERRILLIGEHVDSAKKLYSSAMKIRKEKLKALPIREKEHSPYFDP